MALFARAMHFFKGVRIMKNTNFSVKKNKIGYLFVFPTAIMLAITILFPLVYALRLSFYSKDTFVGFANYIKAIKDLEVRNAFVNTVSFTFFSVLFHALIGLVLAQLLNKVTKGRAILRILLLLPWMIAPVVTGITWRWMLNTQYGVINDILVRIGILKQYLPWLASMNLALPSVIAANIWMRFPYVMIMLFAGLQSIPEELYEAASVDGAAGWTKFTRITLPHLKYIMILTTILDAVYSFRLFDLANVMTSGGPVRASEVLSLLVFRTAFQNFDFNYSSTIAMLVFAVTFLFSIAYIRALDER